MPFCGKGKSAGKISPELSYLDKPPASAPLTPEGIEPDRSMQLYPPTNDPLNRVQTPLLAVGGMGSKTNDNFFNFLTKNFGTNVTQVPLAGKKLSDVEGDVRGIVRKYSESGEPLNVLGHSLGGSMLGKIQGESRLNPAPNINYIQADPPTQPPWKYAPSFLLNRIPTTRLIKQGMESGVEYNPGTVDWSDGRTIMWGKNPRHSPWNNPDAPGNQQRMDDLINLIRNSRPGTP